MVVFLALQTIDHTNIQCRTLQKGDSIGLVCFICSKCTLCRHLGNRNYPQGVHDKQKRHSTITRQQKRWFREVSREIRMMYNVWTLLAWADRRMSSWWLEAPCCQIGTRPSTNTTPTRRCPQSKLIKSVSTMFSECWLWGVHLENVCDIAGFLSAGETIFSV